MSSKRDLEGRVALLTGAGAGIGRATSLLLAGEGASVAVTDIHEGRMKEAVAELQGMGATAEGLVLDAGDVDACAAAADWVSDRLGPPDILIANAALNIVAPLHELGLDDFDAVMNVDLRGPWALARAVIPAMIQRGSGAIVNVSSVASWVAGYTEGAYSAAKAALQSVTRSFAAELGPYGVRCNAVAPGFIETRFVQRHRDRFAPEILRTPLGRFGTPSEIAEVILFLCSDRSSFITGETITASGGWYFHA